MPRLSNIPFVGATVFDVDVDAATYRRVVKNAVADTAGVYDMVTGQNAPSVTLTRDGTAGKGCLLGVPLVNQWIGRSFDVVTGAALTDIYLLCVPVYVSPGETEVMVHITADLENAGLQPRAAIRDAAFAVISEGPLLATGIGGRRGHHPRDYSTMLTGVTSGLRFVTVEVDMSALNLQLGFVLDCWSVYYPRTEGNPNAPAPSRDVVTANPYPVSTPSATEGTVFVDVQAGLFPTTYAHAIDGKMLVDLNRNQNGLIEYMTGWPVGGQKDYTHIDHDGAGAPDATNPARSRFWAATRSLYANEAEFPFPLLCWACGPAVVLGGGGLVVTPASPPTVGMVSWFPPWHDANAGVKVLVARCPVQTPDFDNAPSRLKWAVLLTSTSTASKAAWTVEVACAGGAAGTATPTLITGTNLFLATGTGLVFGVDTTGVVDVSLTKAGAKATHGELAVVGVCLYYEP